VLSAAFNLLAIALFFATDAHHLLLRGFALSLEILPPGGGWSIEHAAAPLAKQVAATFSLGFVMVAPVVLCLLLVELSLGVLSRNMPQMNMFALAVPIKVVVGVGTLALFVSALSSIGPRVNDSIFRAWEAMFR
jgi:flagellar biosynthetic protein FliR